LAEEYLRFAQSDTVKRRPHYGPLCEEFLREYRFAARWVLGERNLDRARPTDRLWAGLPTVSGQMALLPLAALYAGRPADAYRAAYTAAFFDVGTAKDINSAVVAGLAAALTVSVSPNSTVHAWNEIEHTMRTVDPYGYLKIPFATRPVVQWLDFAHDAVRAADGRPKRLFEILEQEGEAKYYWEAHSALSVAFAILRICHYDPLAALHLTLDFGHDTDSVAQLVGGFAGAVYGADVFPLHMRRQVAERLQEDYDESLSAWVEILFAHRKLPTPHSE
jgi:hypothetical protein